MARKILGVVLGILCVLLGILMTYAIGRFSGFNRGFRHGLTEGKCVERFGDCIWDSECYGVYEKEVSSEPEGLFERQWDGTPSIPVALDTDESVPMSDFEYFLWHLGNCWDFLFEM